MPLRELGRKSQKHKLKPQLKQRFNGACAYCGCIPRVLTLDHIVAQSKGGRNVRSNLVAVCHRCNLSKGSMALWQWWQAAPWWDEERAIAVAATVLVCPLKSPTSSVPPLPLS
ncbi:HNH endonuclease [Leptolyngbya sp. AN03gr2]|uniref:HNH endonuclease n=1 Tax=unclassified Leptolyngbya TaxID=2650499 RepID=UPI003D320F9E